jgi:hypothetical protein
VFRGLAQVEERQRGDVTNVPGEHTTPAVPSDYKLTDEQMIEFWYVDGADGLRAAPAGLAR